MTDTTKKTFKSAACTFFSLLALSLFSLTVFAANAPSNTPPPSTAQLTNKLEANHAVDLTYYSNTSLTSALIRPGASVSFLSLNQLIVPTTIINVQDQVNQNNNHEISTQDITKFEKANGQIPPNSTVIINTGWYKKHNNAETYLGNTDTKTKQFPTISNAALQLLASRNIYGLGIDAPNPNTINPGANTLLVNQQKAPYLIYNLDNLDSLPIKGATLVIGVLPTQTNTTLARVFALLP